MRIVLIIKSNNQVALHLKQEERVIDELYLTISQDFDRLLIIAIDKLLTKNRINRLSLKTMNIQGKLRPEAVSSMILQTVGAALEV